MNKKFIEQYSKIEKIFKMIEIEMDNRNWSVIDLARAAGLRRETVYTWLRRDQKNLRLASMLLMLDALGIGLELTGSNHTKKVTIIKEKL